MKRVFLDPWKKNLLENGIFRGPSGKPGEDFVPTPWVYLRQACKDAGIDLLTADYMPRAESTGPKHLYYSFGQIRGLTTICQRPDVIPAGIYLFEPPIGVARPQDDLYRRLPLLAKTFKRIHTTSPLAAIRRFVDVPEQIPLHPFCYPQPLNEVIDALWARKDRKFLTMINSYSYSPLPVREYYSERVVALRYFAPRGEIDLYGFRWKETLCRAPHLWMRSFLACCARCDRVRFLRELALWRGAKDILGVLRPGRQGNKYQTMAGYRFAICYESMGIEGFITEKIFDCFFAGTIPIYLGAPDITDHVPANCFIDRRNFASYSDLDRYLKSLSQDACEKMRQSAREFLASSSYRPFSKEQFAMEFIADVKVCLSEEGRPLAPPSVN
jgi:hypothetical protein